MSYERFARQYRFEPPSGFPLTSPCTSIVHHLSGPSIYALARHRAKASTRCPGCVPYGSPPIIELSPHSGFDTLVLAHMLDSLVRVSRRVGSHRADAPSWHQQTPEGGRAGRGKCPRSRAQHWNHPHCRSNWRVLLARSETMVRTGFRQAEVQLSANTIRLLPTISRTVSLSFQSPFHLSLTVLVRYRSPTNI